VHAVLVREWKVPTVAIEVNERCGRHAVRPLYLPLAGRHIDRALDVAALHQALAGASHMLAFSFGRQIVEKRGLRSRGDRPRSRAPEPRNELPPSDHWITSSAVASSVSGMARPSAFAVLRLRSI